MNSTEQIITQLANIVGASHLSSASADVDAYGGLSPFVVAWPGSPPEAAALLKLCSELGVVVVVAGSGTRLVRHWPVDENRNCVVLDTRRMTNILDVDEVSLTVHSQTGIIIRHLEEALNRHGLSLGHFPSELYSSTLGGLLAAPPPRAHSPRSGWFLDRCLGISVAHADGSSIQTRVAPRRATGPEIMRLYLGSRGGLGVITTAVLKVQPLPEEELPLVYAFPHLREALIGVQRCLADGLRPARLRVLNTEQKKLELDLSLLNTALPADGVLCFLLLAGPTAMVTSEQQLVDQRFVESGGSELSRSVAHRWWMAAQRGPEKAVLPPIHQGSRQPFDQMAHFLADMPTTIGDHQLGLAVDEFTLQGATFWFFAPHLAPENGRGVLNTALLDRGVDPLRTSFPPLIEHLRAKLDPMNTLVVMEN